MPERIPATAWFPPQEPANPSVCREAQAPLTRDGLAAAGSLAVLCVRDSGVGIPAESLPRIFEEFVRVPGSQPGEGAGLSLAIVRRLALTMGRRVWAESTPAAKAADSSSSCLSGRGQGDGA
jgi:signal transduction histidine kinase